MDPDQDKQYVCHSAEPKAAEKGTRVGANQEVNSVAFEQNVSSIILNHHPWVAKGTEYLNLSREEKADIIWEKVTES